MHSVSKIVVRQDNVSQALKSCKLLTGVQQIAAGSERPNGLK